MSSSGGIQPGGGGGTSFPTFTGAGSPEGVQVGTVGQYYEDTATGILYQKASGVGTNTGWTGAVQFDTSDDSTVAGPNFVLPADGAPHDLTHAPAGPPAWINGAGVIQTPGLYQFVYIVSAGVAPTTPGKIARLSGGFNLQTMINLTDLTSLADQLTLPEVGVIATADLPWTVQAQVAMPTDATATMNAKIFVQRLMFPAP